MRVGPYEVLAKAGEGAMGVVYRARDPGLDREVALKVMRAGGGDAGRFATEMQALARLRHENVVAVHAAGVENGSPFLAMEWVDGTTLREHLRRAGPLPELEARRVVGGVARALEYAHARGVVHRDVKPENVLLASDGRVLLADFGVARLLGRETRVTITGEVVGTPAYAAPEQASGDVAAIGPATDVWALGVLLYEVLTGASPFLRASLVATLEAILTQAPPATSALDPALGAVVRRCLQKDPVQRGAAADVADALGTAARRSSAARRGPPAPLLAAAAVAVVAGAVALSFASRVDDAARRPAVPVSLPPAGPRLILDAPQPGEETAARVVVRGRLSPPVAGARVRVGAAETGASDRDGRFKVVLELEPGERTLEVVARVGEELVGPPVSVTVLVVPESLRDLQPARRPPLPVPAGLTPLPGSAPRWTARDGSVLRWLPPGTFSTRTIQETERRVTASRGVFLAEKEVTVAQVREFVRATRRPRALVDPRLPGDTPAVLDWFVAQEYCRWAGLRLPTELEWGLGWSELRFPGEAQEWLQDWLTSTGPGATPEPGLERPPSLRRAVGARTNDLGPADGSRRGLRPGLPPHAYRLDEQDELAQALVTRFRVALDPDGAAAALPAPRWDVEAFDFVRETPGDAPPGPATPLDQLRRVARHRIQVDALPHLDLRFSDFGPGEALLNVAGAPIDREFPRDWFIVVATTRVQLPAGRWGIWVLSDDGVRVWRDDELVIDAWKHQYDALNTRTFTLDAPATITVRVEYCENYGSATLSVGLYPD